MMTSKVERARRQAQSDRAKKRHNQELLKQALVSWILRQNAEAKSRQEAMSWENIELKHALLDGISRLLLCITSSRFIPSFLFNLKVSVSSSFLDNNRSLALTQ